MEIPSRFLLIHLFDKPLIRETAFFASSHLWLTFFVIAFLATTACTRLYTGPISYLIRKQRAKSGKLQEPIQAPYWIPFIGNLPYFLWDLEAYWRALKRKYKNVPVKLTLFGQNVYLINDIEDISAVDRKSREIGFYPALAYITMKVFNMGKKDVEIFTEGHNFSAIKDEEGGSEGMGTVTNKQYIKYLNRDHVHVLTEKFAEVLVKDLDRLAQELRIRKVHGGVFETELYDWTKKTMTTASMRALFGDYFFEIIPFHEFHEFYWKFDPSLAPFIASIPRWVLPSLYAAREQLLKGIMRWQDFVVRKAEEDGIPLAPADGETRTWDKYFGARITRERIHLFLSGGLSLEACASAHLTIVFGLLSNAIPVAFWSLVHALSMPEHMLQLQEEFSAAVTSKSPLSFNIKNLATPSSSPLCTSHLQETLRLCVSSFTVRIVLQDTDFGNGVLLKKWSLLLWASRLSQVDAEIWDKSPVCLEEQKLERDHDTEKAKYTAKEFDPHRFHPRLVSSLTKQDKLLREKAMRPFGGGPSLCPGRFFALNEATGFMACVLQIFDIEVVKVGEDVLDWEKGENIRFKSARGWEEGIERKERKKGEVGVDPKYFSMGGMAPDRKVWVRIKAKGMTEGED